MNKEEIIKEAINLSIVNRNRRTIRKDFIIEHLPDVPILPKCLYYFSYFVWNLYNPDDIIIQTMGYQIHHKDKDSLNDNINNLEKMSSFKHNSLHHKGKIISEKQRKQHSEFMKKRPISQETKDKISKAHMGKKFTKEHKENLSKSHIGLLAGEKNYWYGKKGKEHSAYGRIVSEKTRKLLSEAKIGRKHTDDHKRKNSEARKEWWRKKKLGLV